MLCQFWASHGRKDTEIPESPGTAEGCGAQALGGAAERSGTVEPGEKEAQE